MEIRKVSEVARFHGIKAILAGPPGAGKTYSIRTCPGNPLILSAESGLLSIKDLDSDVVVIKHADELREVYQYVAGNPEQYDWLFLDSISEIAEMILTDEKGKVKDQRQAYMALSDQMIRIVKAFRDLSGINIVLIAKEETRTDGLAVAEKIFSCPGQKLAQSLPYLFDEVLWLRTRTDEDGAIRRVFQCQPNESYPQIKDRSGMLDMYETPDWGHIYNKIQGDKTNG